ncbi:MAG: hypothetical protein AAGG72_08225, partial [Pseudomonadota bacterium]
AATKLLPPGIRADSVSSTGTVSTCAGAAEEPNSTETAAKAGDAPAAKADVLNAVPDEQDVRLTCATSALAMGEAPFKQSKGDFTVRLRFSTRENADRQGVWFIDAVDDAHAFSFTRGIASKLCTKGCVARLATGPDPAGTAGEKRQQLEMWAPDPRGVETLKEDQKLAIATVKVPDLSVRISVFEGRKPLVFEQGACKIAAAGADGAAAGDGPNGAPKAIPTEDQPTEDKSTSDKSPEDKSGP